VNGEREGKTACDWFEREGLRAADEGRRADHLDGCASCRKEWEAMRKILDSVAAPELRSPPAGWQRKVWAHIDARESAPAARSWRRWWPVLALPVAAAAAVLVVAVIPPRSPETAAEAPAAQAPVALALALETAVERGPGAPITRGDHKVGDVLVVRLPQPPGGNVALRIYRDDRLLVAECGGPGAAPCRREGGFLELRTPMTAVGRYRASVTASPGELPRAVGSFDSDGAAALQRGASFSSSDPVEVW
jgi:hypothetical protein